MYNLSSITNSASISTCLAVAATALSELAMRTGALALGSICYVTGAGWTAAHYISGGYICQAGGGPIYALASTYIARAGFVGSFGALSLASLIGYVIIQKHEALLKEEKRSYDLEISRNEEELFIDEEEIERSKELDQILRERAASISRTIT